MNPPSVQDAIVPSNHNTTRTITRVQSMVTLLCIVRFRSIRLHRASLRAILRRHVYVTWPAVPKQPRVWRELPAAVFAFVAGIPAMILMPVTLMPLFMSIVIMSIIIVPLVACPIPIAVEAVVVIMAAADQTKKHGQNQRCDHDPGCLQMSHVKLLACRGITGRRPSR
jgi:hypothetical protein